MAGNYEEDRLAQIEAEKDTALQEVKDTYEGMAQEAGAVFDKQIAGVEAYKDQQLQLQQDRTDLTVQQIEQQKEQAQKDYQKEQSAAYTDYQKQTAQHGVQAEQMAASGMAGSGYSESSRVSMYNTYQNRVAAARESYNQVVTNYNNAIAEAKLQNSSVLAEIANKALMQGLELSMQQLQYAQQMATQQLGAKMDVENMYHGRYMDEVSQQNWQKSFDYQMQQDALAQQNWQKTFDYNKSQDWMAQQQEKAALLASGGDFSGYQQMYGLTDQQVQTLKEASLSSTTYKDLSQSELMDWRNLFAGAKSLPKLEELAQLMIACNIDQKIVDTLFGMYVDQFGSGIVDNTEPQFDTTVQTIGGNTPGKRNPFDTTVLQIKK